MTNAVRKARPGLRKVAPLTFANIVLFIWLNFFIALSFYLQRPNASLVVVAGPFNTYFWMAVFILLSLGHMVYLLTKNWKGLRVVMAGGLFFKSIITYALVVLGAKNGFSTVVGVMSLWLGLTWVQFFTLRFFNKAQVLGELR